MKRRLINPTSRRGAVLIAVLACMGIATVLILGSVQNSLLQRRQLRRELQMEQTRWILDAGISRAISLVNSQPEFQPQSWTLHPVMKAYPDTAVEIDVLDEAENGSVRVSVSARLVLPGQDDAIRRTKQILVNRQEE